MPISQFWRRFIIFASGLLLGGLVLGGILMPRTAFSQSTTPQGGTAKAAAAQCSQATVKGTYVFAADGVLIVGSDRVPFALAGVGTFDGKGNGHIVASQSANGKITRLFSLTAKYTVKP